MNWNDQQRVIHGQDEIKNPCNDIQDHTKI